MKSARTMTTEILIADVLRALADTELELSSVTRPIRDCVNGAVRLHYVWAPYHVNEVAGQHVRLITHAGTGVSAQVWALTPWTGTYQGKVRNVLSLPVGNVVTVCAGLVKVLPLLVAGERNEGLLARTAVVTTEEIGQ